jgi:hypothetical protein
MEIMWKRSLDATMAKPCSKMPLSEAAYIGSASTGSNYQESRLILSVHS